MSELENYKIDDHSVNTSQELIDSAIKKVAAILKNKYPDHLSFGDGSYTISRGSTQVMIIVRPFTNEEACVECLANTVMGAKVSPDLMHFLLRKNSELHFGSFGLLFDNTITFSHSFSDKSLDSGQLEISLDSVATISDYYDDIIVDLAGGKRAMDIISVLDN